MSSKKKIETKEAPEAIGPYSQAIIINEGKLLFVSGQLPVNPETGKIIEGDIRQMTRQVLDNLEAILKSGGSSLAQVVRTEIFLKDLNDFAIVNEEYAQRFKQTVFPARQTIQVARLPLDALIEISCIATVL